MTVERHKGFYLTTADAKASHRGTPTRLWRFSAIVGGCMLSVALPSQAANPVVSSATMNDGALSVSGSNFGTKPTAAPVYFQDFSSLEDGMTGRASSAAGLTWSDDTNYNPNNSQIISSDGVGGKAITMFSPTSGSRNTDSGF